jgi:long-chain fatty acid transport protein
MTKKLCLGLAVILLMTSGLLANGLNLNGFGGRATAMGGAFVGLADDYTAVFWNPAGLAQITKTTFGLAGHLLLPTNQYTLGTFSMKTNSKMYPSGLFGFFQPIGDRVVVGVGAYTLSGLGADWNNTGLESALIYPAPASAFTPPVEAYRWRSLIGSITIAPAVAVKLTNWLLLGATLNVNYGFFKTDQWAGIYPETTLNLGQQTMDVKGWGYGATFGLLLKPCDRFSFGATYRTASKLKLSGTTTIENLPLLNAALPDSSGTKLNVTSPTWLAGGVAVKPLANLTVTFDLQWTNWKKLDVLTVNFQAPAWIAAGMTSSPLDLAWANRLQIRGGLEYKIGDFAARVGYYHDPAPAPDLTMNILLPSFTFNSVAVGFGYAKHGFGLDLGLEYLFGQKRTITDLTAAMPGIYQMHMPVPFASVSYAF